MYIIIELYLEIHQNKFFLASVGIIRSHHEKMKQMCEQQLNVLDKVDSGYPSWKGDLLKHLSSACLNLARLVST